jgi:hypothetical protein
LLAFSAAPQRPTHPHQQKPSIEGKPIAAEDAFEAPVPGFAKATGAWIEVMKIKDASDSIRVNREFDANEIDVSDLHSEKHDEPTISMSYGILTCADLEKLRIIFTFIT